MLQKVCRILKGKILAGRELIARRGSLYKLEAENLQHEVKSTMLLNRQAWHAVFIAVSSQPEAMGLGILHVS